MAEGYTVTQINSYIKNLFLRDFVLSRITVKGEVSNCKYHNSGHIYFTLKDPGAELKCVMFQRDREGLLFRLCDGQQVEASGQIAVYEKAGTYQLYARNIKLQGSGELYEKYLELKNRLEEMGMFDPIYKKPIPPYCMGIGVVTAGTGAAIQDIINISKRRNPYVRLVLYPARVQGEGAADSIVRGIKALDAMGLDCLIVGRGGGSQEDLWAFNEEIVAEAVFEAETPVISAVGHETDFTITDFVADLRAPTPSAAAELANFVYDEFEEEITTYEKAFYAALSGKASLIKARLFAYSEKLKRLSPGNYLLQGREKNRGFSGRMEKAVLDKCEKAVRKKEDLKKDILSCMEEKLERTRERMERLAISLDGLSPLKRMSGGYAYLAREDGRAVTGVKDVKEGSLITAYVTGGKIRSRVQDVEELDVGLGFKEK